MNFLQTSSVYKGVGPGLGHKFSDFFLKAVFLCQNFLNRHLLTTGFVLNIVLNALCIYLFNSHNSPILWRLLSSTSQWENWGLEKGNDPPKAAQLVHDSSGTGTRGHHLLRGYPGYLVGYPVSLSLFGYEYTWLDGPANSATFELNCNWNDREVLFIPISSMFCA